MTLGPRFHFTLVPLTLLAFPHAWQRLRQSIAPRVLVTATVLAAVAFLPLQISGMSVRPNQAYEVVKVTGGPRWRAHLILLCLKLRGGPSGVELYRKSDFVPLAPGDVDV